MMFTIKMRNLLRCFLVMIFAAGLFFSCTSAANRSQLADATDYETEGWIDDEIFQVRTIGAPSKTAKGFVKRRTQSEEAALLSAQKRVIELLVGANVKGASSSQDGESTGIVITKEFKAFIKGGAVVRKSFDPDDNCEIVYRIHGDDLRAKAASLVK